MNKNISLIVLTVLLTAFTPSPAQSTLIPPATNTTGPPKPTKTPTNTPVPPTPTPLPFDSFLDSYCGPELDGIHHRFLNSEHSLAANKAEGPSLYFICHQGENYYFHATGFKPEEFIIPGSGIRVKDPTGDFNSLPSVTIFSGPDRSNMMVYITFNGFEPIGDWTLIIIGAEGSEASASFSYVPSEPSLFIYDQEGDEKGDPIYFAIGTGWDPGDRSRCSCARRRRGAPPAGPSCRGRRDSPDRARSARFARRGSTDARSPVPVRERSARLTPVSRARHTVGIRLSDSRLDLSFFRPVPGH